MFLELQNHQYFDPGLFLAAEINFFNQVTAQTRQRCFSPAGIQNLPLCNASSKENSKLSGKRRIKLWGGGGWSLSTLKAGDPEGSRYPPPAHLASFQLQASSLQLSVTSSSMSKGRDYSSQTYTPSSTGPTKSYPTGSKIDPSGKSREKEDMVGLNDKFVRLIDKVKHLEDENKKLDTKLKILKEQEDYDGKIDNIVRQLEDEMEQQIDSLLRDQAKLQAELLKNQEEVEDTKKSYEDEFHKKADLENEFIVSKKDVDEGHLEAVDLALELEDLMGKLDFLRVGYDEEIKELESQVQNQTVVLRDDSKRSLDLDEIVESVKKQYENMATRTREEAEHWNQKKMDALVLNAGQREQDVRDIRREIADLVRHIQRLRGDLDNLKRKEESLKQDINEARAEGDNNLEKAREDIGQLKEAMKRAKQDLAGQIRDHQELMNLKLALDIEIATYHKLLEGEEQRMNDLMRHADF